MTEPSLFESESPSSNWDKESSKRALDDLFETTFAYRKSKEFYDLMKFVTKFHFYSPYNAFLICSQRPGATYVAPSHRWLKDFGYRVKPNANPMVILQPMGPVIFVFDVSDTEPLPDAKPLPIAVTNPFKVRKGRVHKELSCAIENSKRDGIKIYYQKTGSQLAGSIQAISMGQVSEQLKFQIGWDKNRTPIYKLFPVRYELCLKEDSEENFKTENYATLVHELAHLYCGHLGTPNKKWWPDRRGLSLPVREFEAESVSYLVCNRLGIKTPSEEYLSGYTKNQEKLPTSISPTTQFINFILDFLSMFRHTTQQLIK
jgi:hypothetical protein